MKYGVVELFFQEVDGGVAEAPTDGACQQNIKRTKKEKKRPRERFGANKALTCNFIVLQYVNLPAVWL